MCSLSWAAHSGLEKDNCLDHSYVSPRMVVYNYDIRLDTITSLPHGTREVETVPMGQQPQLNRLEIIDCKL